MCAAWVAGGEWACVDGPKNVRPYLVPMPSTMPSLSYPDSSPIPLSDDLEVIRDEIIRAGSEQTGELFDPRGDSYEDPILGDCFESPLILPNSFGAYYAHEV